jgi:hypothetical protein
MISYPRRRQPGRESGPPDDLVTSTTGATALTLICSYTVQEPPSEKVLEGRDETRPRLPLLRFKLASLSFFAPSLSFSLSCTATRAITDAPADNARLTLVILLLLLRSPWSGPAHPPVQQRTRRARYRPSLQRGLPGLQRLGSKAPVRATGRGFLS